MGGKDPTGELMVLQPMSAVFNAAYIHVKTI